MKQKQKIKTTARRDIYHIRAYLDFPSAVLCLSATAQQTENVCSHSITIAIRTFERLFCRSKQKLWFRFVDTIFSYFPHFFSFFRLFVSFFFLSRRGFSPIPTTSFSKNEQVSEFSVNFDGGLESNVVHRTTSIDKKNQLDESIK